MIRQSRIDRCLDTIWAIASSRFVKWFVVGYTAQPGAHRLRASYYAANFDHLVILADKPSRTDALQLEERLQYSCKTGAARGDPYRRKYHPDHRSDVYRRSIGKSPRARANAPVHSVYMAWMEP